ncbi:hypothetical protein ACJX0J_033594, partial [Zea mays]
MIFSRYINLPIRRGEEKHTDPTTPKWLQTVPKKPNAISLNFHENNLLISFIIGEVKNTIIKCVLPSHMLYIEHMHHDHLVYVRFIYTLLFLDDSFLCYYYQMIISMDLLRSGTTNLAVDINFHKEKTYSIIKLRDLCLLSKESLTTKATWVSHKTNSDFSAHQHDFSFPIKDHLNLTLINQKQRQKNSAIYSARSYAVKAVGKQIIILVLIEFHGKELKDVLKHPSEKDNKPADTSTDKTVTSIIWASMTKNTSAKNTNRCLSLELFLQADIENILHPLYLVSLQFDLFLGISCDFCEWTHALFFIGLESS